MSKPVADAAEVAAGRAGGGGGAVLAPATAGNVARALNHSQLVALLGVPQVQLAVQRALGKKEKSAYARTR